MHRAFSVPARRRLSWPVGVVLVLALLWAQLLGLAHGVRHVHGGTAAVAAAGEAHVHAQDLLTHMLSPAGDETDCRLYDQLAHGAPAPQLPAAAVQPLPLVPAWVVLQALQPRPCLAFAARAPPSFR